MAHHRAEQEQRLAEVESTLAALYATARQDIFYGFIRAALIAGVLTGLYFYAASDNVKEALLLYIALTGSAFFIDTMVNWRKMPFCPHLGRLTLSGPVFEKIQKLDAKRADLIYTLHRKRLSTSHSFGCFYMVVMYAWLVASLYYILAITIL